VSQGETPSCSWSKRSSGRSRADGGRQVTPPQRRSRSGRSGAYVATRNGIRGRRHRRRGLSAPGTSPTAAPASGACYSRVTSLKPSTGRTGFDTAHPLAPRGNRLATFMATSRSSDASRSSRIVDVMDDLARNGRIGHLTDRVEGLVRLTGCRDDRRRLDGDRSGSAMRALPYGRG
jgi:hypothetical protein